MNIKITLKNNIKIDLKIIHEKRTHKLKLNDNVLVLTVKDNLQIHFQHQRQIII